jgi:hypothetical protein
MNPENVANIGDNNGILFSVLAFLLEEINEGTKRHIFVAIFPELTQTDTQQKYIAADCSLHGDRVTYVNSLTAQHIYCTNTVQSATELYLQ